MVLGAMVRIARYQGTGCTDLWHEDRSSHDPGRFLNFRAALTRRTPDAPLEIPDEPYGRLAAQSGRIGPMRRTLVGHVVPSDFTPSPQTEGKTWSSHDNCACWRWRYWCAAPPHRRRRCR